MKVAIIDDHRLFADGLGEAIKAYAARGLELVGVAYSGWAALELVKGAFPDTLLLDIAMPGPPRLQLLSQLHAINPAMKIVILSMHADALTLVPDEGAHITRVLSKTIPLPALIKILTSYAADTVSNEYAAPPIPSLSIRECKVLRLLATGATNAMIANELSISIPTAKRHVSAIMAATSAHSRSHAVARARTIGLL